MKALKRIAWVLAAAVLLVASASTPARADVSFGFFYSQLEPHGSWLVSASYGRVWQPSVYAAGWNPYYDGHWVYTSLGWTWVSDYRWGEIPFHYGTWVPDPVYGWVWVPGYVWAPSWVVFRTGPDYIGWCPVRPEFRVGVSFGFSDYDRSLFVFLPARHFVGERVRTFVVPAREVNVIYNRTTVVKNGLALDRDVVVNRGPDVKWVERTAGRSVERVSIERVRGVAPGERFSREAVRIDPRRAKNGLRAAEPVDAGRREAFKERKRPVAERVSEARRPEIRAGRETSAAPSRRSTVEDRFREPKERSPRREKARSVEARPSTPRMRREAQVTEVRSSTRQVREKARGPGARSSEPRMSVSRSNQRERGRAQEPAREPAKREKGRKSGR